MLGQHVLVVGTRIGTPLVGMVEEPRCRPTTLQCHLERRDDEMPVVDGTQGPADEEPGVEIEDRRQVACAAATDHDLRRVSHPPLIRRVGDKLLRKHVGGDRLVVLAHRRLREPLPHASLEPLGPHEPDDAFAADQCARVDQILVDPRTAVPAPTRLMGRADHDPQLPVSLRVRRLGPPTPRIEPTRRDLKGTTQDPNREGRLLCANEREPYAFSFTKKAAAFFRISRSVRSTRFSFRNRRSSSRSSVVNPVRPFVRSARARSTQFRKADSVRSSSRATWPAVLPSSSTNRTAPVLNSSVNRRRCRRGFVLLAIVDIVPAFRKVSTKPDQAQH